MPTIPRFVPPPSPTMAIREIALAVLAIDYTRKLTAPTEPFPGDGPRAMSMSAKT